MMLTAEQVAAGEALEKVLFVYLDDYMSEHRELPPPVVVGALVRMAAVISTIVDIGEESFLRGAKSAYAAALRFEKGQRG